MEELKRILADVPRRGEFILTSGRGEAWTADGFKTAWQRQMAEKALEPLRKQKCVFHGLRKSAVVMLLEAGCTDAEVSAITGQSREMVVHYAQAVNQRKLAAAAILKWEALRETDTSLGGGRVGAIRRLALIPRRARRARSNLSRWSMICSRVVGMGLRFLAHAFSSFFASLVGIDLAMYLL